MKTREGIAACVEYPVKTRRGIKNELLEIHQSPRIAISTTDDGESRRIIVGLNLMVKDVEKSNMGEFFASRLLTPYEILAGEEEVKSLTQKYIRRAIREIVYDAVSDYGLGVFNMRFLPQYFLYKKIKARISLYPPAYRIYWWITDESSDLLRTVLKRVEKELESLCDEGLLTRSVDGYYSVNREVAKSLDLSSLDRPLPSLKINSRITTLFKAGKIGLTSPLLLISETVDLPIEDQQLDPDEYAYITTSTGIHSLASSQDIYELVSNYSGVKSERIEITKRGALFNSTYVAFVRRDSEPAAGLFIKRYESWTDVKWVVAKIWTMHLRNFYYSASVRLGNELFFLSYLRERGFNVPKVIHVDWERKIIVEEAIDGVDLTYSWIKKSRKGLEEITGACGAMLARIHKSGVVVGDCKPDNFIIDSDGKVWIVDLEQASLRGDQSWDVAECVLYMGHYLDGDELEEYAESLISGYLSEGDQKTVEKALDPRYQFVMLPWTPIWNQLRVVEVVKKLLKK